MGKWALLIARTNAPDKLLTESIHGAPIWDVTTQKSKIYIAIRQAHRTLKPNRPYILVAKPKLLAILEKYFR